MSTETTAPADRANITEAELARLRSGAETLGKIVCWQAQSMEAARIEMIQNGPEKAMQWILNSIPDVDDNDPADQWNGTETAREWLDRQQAADKAWEAAKAAEAGRCRDCGNTAPELLMRLGEALCPSCWDAAEALAADPLILSPDEFTAVKTVAAVLGLPGSALEPDGPGETILRTPEDVSKLEARFREAVANPGPLTVLLSDRWQERAEAAEAKLAEVRAELEIGWPRLLQSSSDAAVQRILAIIGSEEGADHG